MISNLFLKLGFYTRLVLGTHVYDFEHVNYSRFFVSGWGPVGT